MSGGLSISSSIRTLSRVLIDFVFPPSCLSCQNLLQPGERHLCPSCWSSIPRVNSSLPLYQETRAKLLASGEVDELISAFVFEKDGPFQSLVHALKYGGFVSVGRLLGNRVGEEMKLAGIEADALIPIPLHRARKRERGYNQAELIADGISEITGIPVRAGLLKRVKNTRSQTKLSLEERAENMREAFTVPPRVAASLQDSRCVVVDDVITTGATIVSAATVLRSAGARSVFSAAAALAG